MRQSMKFSAAGFGLIVGVCFALALRDSQAEQPSASARLSAVVVATSTSGSMSAQSRGRSVENSRPAVQIKTVGAKLSASPTPASPAVSKPKLVNLAIRSSGKDASSFTLDGCDSHQQLVVMARHSDGQFSDFTRQVRYSSQPAGIVRIDGTGLVWPLADGRVVITAQSPDGGRASIQAVVSHFSDARPVNFPNQIVPIFTKLGCNAGGCHGKHSGQNGFRLSLLGFVPSEDYDHLVKEGRGRRLSPAAPDSSLILQKATGQIPHGGGQRMEVGSVPYKLLRRWIAEGMPYGKADDPVVSSIEVVPTMRTLKAGAQQQLICLAHYSDGSVEDVTMMTKFEPNDTEMAEVSSSGLVTARDLPGTVAVMARYQGQVAVFRAALPLGAPINNIPAAKNFIDEAVFKQLRTLGIPPSPVCDDSTFIRRTSLDLAGRLPTADETTRFLADTDPAKRARWIDLLLESPGYADNFATKWTSVLRNKRVDSNYEHADFLFHDWIRLNR